MLRGVDPPPVPSPPLSQCTCQITTDAFNNIIRGNKGYGGGVLRIESLTRGLLYEGAWGKTQHTSSNGKSNGVSMTPTVSFEVASITKTFTATLLLLLLSRGTPPFLAGKPDNTSTTLGNNRSGERIGTSLRFDSSSPPSSASFLSLGLDTTLADASASPSFLLSLLAPPHWHTATLRQLLSHTSGIADYWSEPSFLQAFTESPQRLWTPTEILTYARKQPPLYPSLPPSSSSPFPYYYSDTNYVLLGLLIEGWESKALHEVMNEVLWQASGLKDTYFPYLQPGPPPLPPSPPPPPPNSMAAEVQAAAAAAAAARHENFHVPQQPVLSHRYEGDEDLTDVPRQSADWAGGGMVSSTRDLSNFVKNMLLQGGSEGEKVLLEEMLSKTQLTGEEGGVRYGLGLFVFELVEGEDGVGGRMWGHEGWGHAFMYVYEPPVMKEGGGGETEVLVLAGTVNQQDDRADPWEAMMVALRAVVKDGE